MMSEHVSPVVAALQQVDEPARERIRADAIAQAQPFEQDGKVAVPGLARCIVGPSGSGDRNCRWCSNFTSQPSIDHLCGRDWCESS